MADPWIENLVPAAPVPALGRAPSGNGGIVPRDDGLRAPVAKSTMEPQTALPGNGASREGTVAFWVGKGAPQHVAEGIADRVNAESGFRPTVEGDRGTSIGLYQHHADRKSRLMAVPDWQNPGVQHEHAYSEVMGGDPIAAKNWDKILAAPNRQTAAHLWDKYFERSKGSQSAPWDGQITSAGHFKPSESGIRYENLIGNSVQYVDARDFLAMLPPIEDSARERRKGSTLLKSLMGGDDVEKPPHVEVSVKNGVAKITDYDGRHRAQEAIKAGVDLIPVSFRGLPKEGDAPKTIEGITGVTMPFDFTPAVPPREKPPESVGNRIVGAAGRGMEEAFQGFGPGLKDDVRASLAGMAPGIGKEAATLGASALRTAELPFDLIARSVNAVLMGGARGGGQAIGEVTGAAKATGFDPGIGAIREVIQPGMAFLGGAGMLPGAGMPRGTATPRPGAPAPQRPPTANAMAPGFVPGGPGFPAGQAAVENQARSLVAQKFAADAAGGGPSAVDAIERMAAGRAEGQPMSLMDVGGENVRGLAGTAYRQPGEGRAAMRQFAEDRDVTAPSRVGQLLDKYVSSGSAKATAEQLIAERAGRAKPLWDAARDGMPSIESQFERAFNDASAAEKRATEKVAKIENEVTQAAARQSTAGTSGADKARRFADDKLADQRAILEQAKADKQASLDRLRLAQEDETAKAKGATWSPTLQRLLDYREIQQGLNRGWAIEKRNAAEEIGQGKPFNPRDYAVIGEDAEGNPKVGAVPNMSLLMVAKEGLDAIIESEAMKNPLTGKPTKDGRSYIRLRQAFLNELDKLNPDYKPARDAWSGDTASISALNDGRHVFDAGWFTREELAEKVGKLSPNDREFLQLGMAEKLRDDLYRTADAGDESKRILNNQDRKMRVRVVLGDSERADKFLAGVQREREMFEGRHEVMRGSQTQGRAAEDASARRVDLARGAVDVGMAGVHLGHGNLLASGGAMLRSLSRFTKDKPLDPAVYSAVGRLLTDPNIRMIENASGNLWLPPVRSIPEPGRGQRFLAETLPMVRNAMARGAMNFGPPRPQ